jgi:hypothetical protein
MSPPSQYLAFTDLHLPHDVLHDDPLRLASTTKCHKTGPVSSRFHPCARPGSNQVRRPNNPYDGLRHALE